MVVRIASRAIMEDGQGAVQGQERNFVFVYMYCMFSNESCTWGMGVE